MYLKKKKMSKMPFLKSHWNIIRYISANYRHPHCTSYYYWFNVILKIRGTIDWCQFTRFVCPAHIYLTTTTTKKCSDIFTFTPHWHSFSDSTATCCITFSLVKLVQLSACKVLLCHVNIAFCAANWKISVEIRFQIHRKCMMQSWNQSIHCNSFCCCSVKNAKMFLSGLNNKIESNHANQPASSSFNRFIGNAHRCYS